MEFEISELIRADEKARHDVEEAHRMKFELKQKIAEADQRTGLAAGSSRGGREEGGAGCPDQPGRNGKPQGI